MLGREDFLQHRPRGIGCDAPVLAPGITVPVTSRLARSVTGEEERAAGCEDPSELGDSSADVVDHLQRLRADDAVETVRGNSVGAREVGDDRRVRIGRHNVEDIAACHAIPAKRPRIPRVAELEHTSTDIGRMSGKKALDVVPVDRRSAIESETPAHRFKPAEAAEANAASGTERRKGLRS